MFFQEDQSIYAYWAISKENKVQVRQMEHSSSMLVFSLSLLLSFCDISVCADNITVLESLTNGMTIESQNGTFQLGFFNPESGSNYYLGIWYKNIPVRTVVWVANRQRPVKGLSATLKINNTGNLQLYNNGTVVWSANSATKAQNPILQLLDSGNLVLREEYDENPDNYLWQSFDYPTDTLLPGMKLGKDFRTGMDRRLSAWKNPSDPSPGTFTWSFHITSYPEDIMWLKSEKYYRGAPWNGIGFGGMPSPTVASLFRLTYFSDENETYASYSFSSSDSFPVARRIINQTTLKQEVYVWVELDKSWKLYTEIPKDTCDYFGHCGPYGNCKLSNVPTACDCLEGFKPKVPDDWKAMNYSKGCILDQLLSCQNDKFLQYKHLKVPDTTNSLSDRNMTLIECREKCLRNCSCMAYANYDIRGAGSGCVTWYGDLLDMKFLPDGGQDIYIRSPAQDKHHSQRRRIALTVGSAITVSVILPVLLLLYCSCRKWIRGKEDKRLTIKLHKVKDEDNLDLPLFDLSVVAAATGNFSIHNKLGQGGFGSVYKGTLEDGREIAVKKLAMNSGQGIQEFKNEAKLVNKLQHRNLVKLLGCSIQDEEKLLIYEYMPNKSLDNFIFDAARRKTLDWSQRFRIICGVARGLLYLHQDSRLMIIHRDLKPSNILLDSEMNPKISDFGMARTFWGEQSSANTNRVVGTRGYMAPEYAAYGHFSVKSDVFSFGVLVLEIITGKKNRGLYNPTIDHNLIGHVWNLWKEQRALELIDTCMGDNYNQPEVLRSIHISLLCLQQDPEDRPVISSVVLMLGGNITSLPQPKELGYLLEEDPSDNGLSTATLSVAAR